MAGITTPVASGRQAYAKVFGKRVGQPVQQLTLLCVCVSLPAGVDIPNYVPTVIGHPEFFSKEKNDAGFIVGVLDHHQIIRLAACSVKVRQCNAVTSRADCS
jgi:hypothetical protein